METPDLIAVFVLAALALGGVALDIAKRKLPNWLSFLAILGGLGFAVASSGWSGLGEHAVHAVAALAVGFALYTVGAIGGGDAKFYTGMASWFPLQQGLALLLAVCVIAIACIAVWFGLRRLVWKRERKGDFAKFPYGVAIGFGAIVAFLQPFST